jgi:hypothetical protein
VPGRQRVKNVQRDPRITVLIPGDHPWDYAEVRGHVVEMFGGQQALDHIDFLARRYLGTDSYPNPIGPEGRITLKIVLDKVNVRAGEDQRLSVEQDSNDRPRSTPT